MAESPPTVPLADEVLASLDPELVKEHETLKYHLLGPSLTKAGQDSVDQSKVSEVIYNASKGSKYFNREEEKDKVLTQKIDHILEKKRRLDKVDLTRELRAADQLMSQLEVSRDLTQHIVHVDCDAFYAAVEQLERPELKDVPFAVGAGVLTTCNYAARQFGCRSGMAGFVAQKLCPQLLLIRPNFEKYTSKAHEIREVLADYDPRFESASIDEAYLNVTEYCTEHAMTPEEAVQQLRDEIHEKTRVTVSAGIGANAKLAKICSNMNKPNGQYLLPSDRNAIMTFMRALPTRKVNGIGRVLERELQEIGVKTCGDIYQYRQYLRQLFGDKTYEFLIMCHLGLGRTNVQPAEEYERKSVGTESTFRDISDPSQLRDKLRWTAEELEKDMRRAECKGRTLVLKVKLHTYEVFTRQGVTPKAICQADDLYSYSLPILTKLQHDMPTMKLRLMGLRCTNLVSTKKPDARAFFGLKPLKAESHDPPDGKIKRKASDALEEPESLPNNQLLADDEFRHHGKEIVPNPKKEPQPQEQEDWWDCPICSRPQPTDERLFNDHIDLCLSRQTIRDAVQKDSVHKSPAASDTPPPKRPKSGGEKKRGRSSGSEDPRQRKLFFG
ncbi:Uu.00g029850.m01.CDS01 [Anthostomella pinea]|uniref:DNA polymerase kappa n=1 Tax=Anthostomella pinea TaxID=933095 RepID=A0AAI8YCX8_9PEZI|nr:Uu.00g029850.m01.CDS01 [Anthostomella pinea]